MIIILTQGVAFIIRHTTVRQVEITALAGIRHLT